MGHRARRDRLTPFPTRPLGATVWPVSDEGVDAVDIVRTVWRTYERQGLAAALSVLPVEVECVAEEGESLRGREAIREHLKRLRETRVEYEPRAHRFERHGEHVIVSGALRRVSPEGLADRTFYWTYHLHDGEIVRIEGFGSREAAVARLDGAPA